MKTTYSAYKKYLYILSFLYEMNFCEVYEIFCSPITRYEIYYTLA